MTEGWKERAIEEHEQLTARLEKLWDFAKTAEYDQLDDRVKELLHIQSLAMESYEWALRKRLGGDWP